MLTYGLGGLALVTMGLGVQIFRSRGLKRHIEADITFREAETGIDIVEARSGRDESPEISIVNDSPDVRLK